MSLAVDASDTHLGAVLQQLLDGSWAPLSFNSRKLSDTEKKYSAFDRDFLAAYSSHFLFMLEGRDFTIFTDHKTLTHALFRVPLPWSTHQQCHLSYLAEFTSSVVHVPGPENVVADILSRPSTHSSPAPAPAMASSTLCLRLSFSASIILRRTWFGFLPPTSVAALLPLSPGHETLSVSLRGCYSPRSWISLL